MQHTHQLDVIRDVVTQTFVEYTSPDVEFCESVLIRDGFYCGRRFTSDAVRAVWFAEDNVVKFYGKDGQFLVSRDINDITDGATDSKRQQAA